MSNKLGYYICERNILNIYSDSQNGSLHRPEVQLDFILNLLKFYLLFIADTVKLVKYELI